MKNYEEVTESVFRKSEEIIARKKRRRSVMAKIGVSAGCLVAVAAVGAGVWRGSERGAVYVAPTPQSVSESSANISGAGDTVAESNSENSSAEIAANLPIMTPDNSDVPNSYVFTTIIDGFEVEGDDEKIAPENGSICISKALRAAVDYYGDVDENGNEIYYRVYILYLQDQRNIDVTRGLWESESARRKEQIGHHPGSGRGLNFETYSWDWGAQSENYIWAYFTKSELESFTASENYGYVLDLYDNFFGYSASDDDTPVIF